VPGVPLAKGTGAKISPNQEAGPFHPGDCLASVMWGRRSWTVAKGAGTRSDSEPPAAIHRLPVPWLPAQCCLLAFHLFLCESCSCF